MDMYKETHIAVARTNCTQFLNTAVGRRGGSNHLCFSVTEHAMERLLYDRSKFLTVHGFCAVMTKVLDRNMCELIYLASFVVDDFEARLVITRKGITTAYDVWRDSEGRLYLKLITIYKGVDENDKFTYHRLTID